MGIPYGSTPTTCPVRAVQTWLAELPPPLSPWVLKSEPLAASARLSAGMTPEFLERLVAYVPTEKGRVAPAYDSGA